MTRKLALIAAVALSACGSSSSNNGPTQTPFPRPAGTVALNISVDDRLNQDYLAGQLRWKGGHSVDPVTRILTKDDLWSGKLPGDTTPFLAFPALADDGPWTAGGHEPAGSVAGDHIWGYTAFVAVPAADLNFEYGMIDVTSADLVAGTGDRWIWTKPGGGNGTYTVLASSLTTGADDLDLLGLEIPAYTGTVDIKVVLDLSLLADRGSAWTTSSVKFKTSADGWSEHPVTCAANICTFQLSNFAGAAFHTGLANAGTTPEFVWVLGADEYKIAGAAQHGGVTASYKKPPSTTFVAATLTDVAGGLGGTNTAFAIP